MDQELRSRLGLVPDRPYFDGFSPDSVPSPCFVVDRAAIQYNLDILRKVAEDSGARILAALKAFSMFSVFDQIAESLHGACASGIFEARLAREELMGRGGALEVHTFAPAYKEAELRELLESADHILFNSLAQWLRFRPLCLRAREKRELEFASGQRSARLSFGIRVNPEHSEAEHALYDPSAPYSRLGQSRASFDRDWEDARAKGVENPLDGIEGIHFHNLCEQGSEELERTLEALDRKWSDILGLQEITWLNMGGGHHITKGGYKRDLLVQLVRNTAKKYQLAVYLEPGEAIAIHSGILRSSVVDLFWNQRNLAILDVSATCHMPDTLEMPYTPEVWGAQPGAGKGHLYRLGGQTCLAGDIMGDYRFEQTLEIGSPVIFDDMSHYTMVKTSTFNGIPLPSLAVYDSRTGKTELVKSFAYQDFKSRLS